MKKSFAENCIRYISTATALILALAMLCCANFSASAKDLGSNLTITDTTLLLQDINTTTNTTPAKTKDLIASGAGVEILSTGVSITYSGTEKIYFNKNALPSTWTYSYYYAYFYDSNSTSSGWSDLATHVEDVNGESIYSVTVPNGTWTNIILVNKESSGANWNGSKNQTGNLSLSSGKNYIQGISSDLKTATWSTYSGGSGTPTGDLTIYYKNTDNWSTVNIYCWQNINGNNNNKAWPGESMTKVEGTDNIYKYTISTSSNWDRCIFNDGNNNKTIDLTIPTDGKNYYNGNGSEWTTLYTVTFDANGYGTAPSTQYIVSQGTATEPTPAPTETGYTFGGWYTDSACTNKYNFSTAVTRNITLYAKWTAISTEDITVYFDNSLTQWENVYVFYWAKESLTDIYNDNALKGSGTGVKYKTISNVTSQLLSVDVPYNTTYIAFTSFKGKEDQDMDTYDNFYGKGEKEFIACYYTNSNSKFTLDNNTQKFSSSTTVFTPSGNTESNKYNNDTKYINGTWSEYTVPKHTVTFDNKGHGGTTESQLVTDGQCAKEPTPTETGYTFGGWYTDSACTNKYNFSTAVTRNINLYAKWTANKYTVSFDSQGGNDTPLNIEVTYDGTYEELPTSAGIKKGYEFAGWYTSATGGTQVNSSNVVKITSNQTLYAHWTAKEYSITYVPNEGTINGTYATKYTYGEGATLPTDVTKDGYTFKDWYDNEELTGDPVKSISTTATGDKTFYAKWELNVFKHQYVFLDTTKKDWIFSGGCKVYVSFDDGNSYTKMNELFTNNSGYDSTNNNSKLLFAKVPDNTTKFIFRRQNTSGNHNETPYSYSDFQNDNLLTLQNDIQNYDNKLEGSWSTVDYTPVPINFTVGENGKVYLNNDCVDSNNKPVDMPVAIGTSTIYADKSATSLKVKATPNTGYEVNVLKVNGVESDKSAGGTVDIGALSDNNTVEVTFKAYANPTVTIECYDSTGEKITSGVGITVDGDSEVKTTQTKTVLYKDSTGATFTASVANSHKNNYVFLGYYNTSSASGDKYATGCYDDYSVTVTDGSIKVYNVGSNIKIYAIFAQLYEVKFSYENLDSFTVNDKAVANGGAVYVKEGTSLSLVTTFDEDYKMTSDCWRISPTDVGAFTRNASNATYVVGNKNVEITITPKIATYTGQGKWGSKTLRIDTSSVGASKAGYDPWFAVAFKKSSTDTDNYFIRCSKVSDGLYECVIPDGYTHFDVYRMATGATAFTTSVESSGDNNASTIAWNKTHQVDADNRVVPVEIGSNTSYKLSYNGTVGQMSIATK